MRSARGGGRVRAAGAGARTAAAACLAAALVADPAGAQAPEAAFVTVEEVPVGTPEGLFGVAFADPGNGWAVGAYGRIVSTTDGGATWHPQPSGLPAEATTQAGAASSACEFACGNLLTAVAFTDARMGWAVGLHDVLLATTDGGATWARRAPPPIEGVPGDGPGPATTTERAREWSFRDVGFGDARNGIVVGDGGTILSTSDGGATWTWRGDRSFGSLRAVSVPDPRHAQAVAPGGGGRRPFVSLASSDGGASWQPTGAGETGGGRQSEDFRSVHFVDALVGYVGTGGGQIMATRDGGRRWALQRRDTTEVFQAIAFSGPRRGLAVGYTDVGPQRRASLVATVDGGETWVARLIPGVLAYDVAFASPTTAYVVGCSAAGAGCERSLIARVTFPPAPGAAGGGGVPGALLALAGAVLGAGVAGVVLWRRKH